MTTATKASPQAKKSDDTVSTYVNEENVSRRKAVRLNNLETTSSSKREGLEGPVMWFDSSVIADATPKNDVIARILTSQYSGMIVTLKNIDKLVPAIPQRMKVVLRITSKSELATFEKSAHLEKFIKQPDHFVLSYNDIEPLIDLKEKGVSVCYSCFVDDNESLHSSIYDGLKADFLSILFKDPTNIPLELVIASLQKTGTILMKEISDNEKVDDAVVTLGVMEYGAEGVIFSPARHDVIDQFLKDIDDRSHPKISLQVGVVTKSKPVGMGYRACIDTATLFDPDEGMLIGSTSDGGILCCPEVYFLPYMELRPFRVNAGAVHSYVYNTNDRTDYMSELKAGSNVMLVNSKGRVRTAPVGRMKIEQRPLRLIEVSFENGKTVNVIMQDDWHVRIFSEQATPLNISELKAGDKVLGYTTESGRHVGIKIDEKILEN